jgi:hypothetical protein
VDAEFGFRRLEADGVRVEPHQFDGLVVRAGRDQVAARTPG